MRLFLLFAASLWVLIPAFAANALATFSRRKGPRMDLGRTWPWDGRAILGRSKTWLGFLLGGALGGCVGLLQAWLILLAPPDLQVVPRFGPTLLASVAPVLTLTFGAMVGDAVGSFLKRRQGLSSSAPAPLLDQWPLLLVPIALLAVLFPGLFYSAFWPALAPGLLTLGWVLVVTLFLHTAFNWLGYLMRLKDVPW